MDIRTRSVKEFLYNFFWLWSAIILSILLLNPFVIAKAAASGCFRFAKETQGADAAGRQSSAKRVTLALGIGIDKSCEYAFDPNGPWHSDLETQKSSDTDFATLTYNLREKGPSSNQPARPTTIFARKKAATKSVSHAQIESVFLAGCTEYLLSTGRAFTLNVPVESQQPTITRVPGSDDCGASGMTLYFTALRDAAAPGVVSKGPWPHALLRDAKQFTLHTGRWAIYGARDGSDVGYLVGRINSGSSYTPLRAGLLAKKMAKVAAEEPWLQASWASGSLRFEPTTEALRTSDLWAELRTAAAADALWLAKSASDEANAIPLGRLLLAENGDAIALPSASVTEQMQRRYGPAGKYLVPTYEDWRGLRDGLQVCLAPRYEATRIGDPRMARLPAGSTCSALASLTAPFTVQAGGLPASGQVCVRKRVNVMTAEGPKTESKAAETCVSLPIGAPGENLPDFVLASLGDEIRFSGSTSSPLFLCTDNQCQPLPADLWLPFSKAGLVEIRRGASAEQALSSQGLTLLRLGVIDVASEWHPVGLYTASGTPPSNRWTALEHDEKEVFTYLRRRHRIDFHLATSPALAAAWNARADLPSQMSEHIPVVGGAKGSFAGARPTTFATLVTESAECPKDTAAEFREKPLVDPEKLLPDQRFYVHLAQYQGEDKPFQCAARAGFRVAQRRSIPFVPQIRGGLIGDTQLVLFITNKPALGLMLPLAYAYWRLVYGIGVDASVSLTAAGTFSKAELSRTGLGLSASAVWGPEQDLPRLISVGGILHLATGTGKKQPIGSIFVACNLASLIDIAGGR